MTGGRAAGNGSVCASRVCCPRSKADLLNRLPLVDAAVVVTVLPVSRAIEVCDHPAMRRPGAILERLEPERAAEILEGLSADERTDVIQQMGEHERRRLLPKLSATGRWEVEHLLRYPDHTAGGIMTTEFVRLDPAMTVGEALKPIRTVARGKETIYAGHVLEPGTERRGCARPARPRRGASSPAAVVTPRALGRLSCLTDHADIAGVVIAALIPR